MHTFRKMPINKSNVFVCTCAILFCIFVVRISAAQTELSFEGINVNHNESNSSPEGNITTEGNEKLPFSDFTFEFKKGGIRRLEYSCKNGGTLSKDPGKLCECKEGTSGGFCEIVDGCVRKPKKCGNDPDSECVYDLKEEKAKCDCKSIGKLFDNEKLKCRKMCRDDNYCWNGGKCVSNFCECLPGTSGDDCTTVNACDTDANTRKECGDPDLVYCKYNVTTHSISCECRIMEYFYDIYDMTCKDCDCGPDGNCTFVKGKKTCDCKDGYAVNDFDYKFDFGNRRECRDCKCGEHSNGCTFKSLLTKECNCDEGYVQNLDHICEKCDCGSYGKCGFHMWRKMCYCISGFENNNGTCEDCYCGRYGKCSFENGKKECTCQSGYAVDDDSLIFGGKCMWCNCYFGEELMNCTFSAANKHCFCPEGYEQIGNICTDINECLDPNSCPHNTICENTVGSYKCLCKEGYRPSKDDEIKRYGCLDINECEESFPCPFADTTNCVNTPGSYACVCKEGYLPQSYTIESEKHMGCWKDQSSWKYGYIVLVLAFCFISLGFLCAICRRYRTNP